MSESDLSPDARVRSLDLDAQLKTTLIRLCRELGIPHSGLKSQLVSRLLAYHARLPSSFPALADAAVAPFATVASPTSAAPTATATTLTTALGQALPRVSPGPQTAAGPSYAQLPPLPAHLASLGAVNNFTLPLTATAVQRQTVPVITATVTSLLPQTSLSCPPSHNLLAPLPAAAAPVPGPPQVRDLQHIALQAAQQAAQNAAQYAVSQVLSWQASARFSAPPPTTSVSPPASQVSAPTAPPTQAAGTTPTWVYQPPTILPHHYAATFPASHTTMAPLPTVAPPLTTALPLGPAVTLPQFAPLSGTIPTIPSKFATAAAAGEFVDFCELLRAVEVEGGEETPLFVQAGESHQLTLPRKPKKKAISSFSQWARCLCIYGNCLAAHQHFRGLVSGGLHGARVCSPCVLGLRCCLS